MNQGCHSTEATENDTISHSTLASKKNTTNPSQSLGDAVMISPTDGQSWIQQYQASEHAFFSSLPVGDFQDCYMYGEVAFCLAGLKPVVLIDLPPALEKQYVATVLDPWIQAFNGAHRQQQQQWQRLQRRLLTPEMHGMMVTFLLGPHTPTAVSNQLQHTSIDSEQALASLLDYPGHLPANAQQLQTMLEVAYFNKANHQLLTTFACQQPETPLVQRHFDQYATVMKSFGLDIGLVIRSPI